MCCLSYSSLESDVSSLSDTYLTILIPLFGLVVGSFANVLICRIPRGEEWVHTPSHCMACGHLLRWFELVPVVSWLAQRGRCRACKVPISRRYPAVELMNAALWLICVLAFGADPMLPVALALATSLLVLSVIDWDTQEIPDGIQVFLLTVGLIWNGYALWAGLHIWLSNLIGFFAVSVPLLLLSVATKGGMGGGDIKLTAVCGLILGWQSSLLALALAALSGTLFMLPSLLFKKRGWKSQVPFGPFLAAGYFFSMCFGSAFIGWYLSLF